MNKLRVIDLLNKIANGEEVHFCVINKGFKTEYFYEKGKPLRYDDDEDVEWRISEDWLNCEVEIIEEDKKIERMTQLNNVSGASDLVAISQMQWENNLKIERKINEIINYLEENK